MKIFLIRHTSVAVEKGTCYGFSDVALSDRFEEEAQRVKQNLSEFGEFDCVFSSPLSRATMLAMYCGYSDCKIDDRLKEMNMGDWEMKKYDKISDPNLIRWYEDYKNTPTTNGESFSDLIARVKSFFDELRRKDYSKVAIFTHSGVISAAMIYTSASDNLNCWDNMPEYGEIREIEI